MFKSWGCQQVNNNDIPGLYTSHRIFDNGTKKKPLKSGFFLTALFFQIDIILERKPFYLICPRMIPPGLVVE